MFPRFGLVLMVNHACNLRCTYCYTGEKLSRPMPRAVARRSIERAVASLEPGGTLELSFFGGEPLIEAELIEELIDFATGALRARKQDLQVTMTNNGTIRSPAAQRVLLHPQMNLFVSHDGLPEIHDRHRVTLHGGGSSDDVLQTIHWLTARNCDFGVLMVVRPDTVASLPAGIRWLREQGVRHVVPSLDIWATWTRTDAARLKAALSRVADLWREGLPDCSISWFDERAARLLNVPSNTTMRCGFGHGEIAVAPSGNLYPCERLIGADLLNNPMRLPGHALDGNDFCDDHSADGRSAEPCAACALQEVCSTSCRCSNYVRTGDVHRPDGLLCLLDTVCFQEAARVLAPQEVVHVGG